VGNSAIQGFNGQKRKENRRPGHRLNLAGDMAGSRHVNAAKLSRIFNQFDQNFHVAKRHDLGEVPADPNSPSLKDFHMTISFRK